MSAAVAGPRSGSGAGGGGGPGGRGPGPRGGGCGGGGRMIKLFSLKQQKKEEESAGGTKGSSKKASAAQLRIQKDINELNLPKTCDISFSDPDDLLNFKLVICPDEGFYKSGKFVFSFKVGQGYPHDPPKVKCEWSCGLLVLPRMTLIKIDLQRGKSDLTWESQGHLVQIQLLIYQIHTD